MKKIVIFDLDGTLAIINKRRIKAGSPTGDKPQKNKMNWDVFHDASNIYLDEPNTPVIKMAQLFAEDGFTIIIFFEQVSQDGRDLFILKNLVLINSPDSKNGQHNQRNDGEYGYSKTLDALGGFDAELI